MASPPDAAWRDLPVDLEPVRGAEASKTRPAVIVSNDGANITATRLGRGVVTVFPVTSNVEQITLSRYSSPLPRQDCSRTLEGASAEQVRSVAVERMGGRVALVPAFLMLQLDEAVRLHLSL
jgi:mRNA interferase MazF